MRQIVMQYPDGKYHTIQATRFYGMLINGKEEYILEYDDLTTSTRNCFTVLDRQGNTFVKRPLASQVEYSALAVRIRFMLKKFYDLNVLPGKIALCSAALEALKIYAPPVADTKSKTQTVISSPKSPQKPKANTQKRKAVVIYVDVAVNHDVFPYYLGASTARNLGLSSCAGGFYHLTSREVDKIKEDNDIQYKNAALGLGFGSVVVNRSNGIVNSRASAGGTPPTPPNRVVVIDNTPPPPPPHNPVGVAGIVPPRPPLSNNVASAGGTPPPPPPPPNHNVELFIVYEDIAPIREEHPFYLKREDAARCSLRTEKEYYHLRKEELEVLYRFATVQIEKKYLAILKQKETRQRNIQVPVPQPVALTASEIETLERLFDKLMDFEDYYSFFGIEDLRNSSPSQVLNDPRIVNLTILFQKGAACNNEYAINFVEFLENFKKSLKTNSLNK